MEVKLKEICIINPKSPGFQNDFIVSFVPMPKVGENGEFDPSEIKTYQEVKKGFTYFQNGDVLFAKITPCMENGKGAIAQSLENGIGFGSTEFHVLRPFPEYVTSKWLYYLLSWPLFRIEAGKCMTGSAGQKRVPKSFLEEYNVDLPDLSTQEEVTNTLDKVCNLISLRKQQLAKLDELVKVRFVEMFGNITETVPLSYYILALSAGKSLAGEKECTNKVLKTGAATYDEFDPTQIKNLPTDYIPQADHLLKTGDIIISRMNTLELVGATAYVWEAPQNTYLPDRLWRAEINKNTCPVFVWQLLIQDSSKEEIRKIASGTSGSMKNISKPGLLGIRVKKVEFEIQQKFSIFVEQIHRQKLTTQQSLDKLEILKKTLMQEYFG